MKIAPKLENTGQARNSVEVHIEELVLHGFAPGDRKAIAHAVEQELVHLMGEGGAPRWRRNPPALDRVDAGAFRVKVGAKPQATGAEIARAVFRSLRPQARGSAHGSLARPSLGGRRP